MYFTSIQFLLFLILVLGVYHICPGCVRKYILLLSNITFYYFYGIENLMLLVVMIVISYFAGLLLRKKQDKKILILSLIALLSPLIILKYSVFCMESIQELMCFGGLAMKAPAYSLIEPVGLSFFTFKIISFLIEEYKGNVQSHYHLLDYAVYVSFFPTITSGPIDRPADFMEQINKRKPFEYETFIHALLLILYGFFQKLVIADRLAIVVGNVLDNYESYQGFPLLVTFILYSLQIYLDFSGYTCIAVGAAEAMGYHCINNFAAPYFSRNIREFWQRWHISLSSWLRDYIYIPLGGNRKGKQRKYANLLITFLISGIWHGAGWNYVIWGLLHGLFIVVGEATVQMRLRIKEKLRIVGTRFEKVLETLCTFTLVTFAWIFFRTVSGFENVINLLGRAFSKGVISFEWLNTAGITELEVAILLISLVVVSVIDYVRYKNVNIYSWFRERNLIVKYAAVYVIFFFILVFGIYGPNYDSSAFIYFQF